jgi:ABC-type microcin C transport system permease subunit YejE
MWRLAFLALHTSYLCFYILCSLANLFKTRFWNITRISHILGAISFARDVRVNQATSGSTIPFRAFLFLTA